MTDLLLFGLGCPMVIIPCFRQGAGLMREQLTHNTHVTCPLPDFEPALRLRVDGNKAHRQSEGGNSGRSAVGQIRL
ncbi:hypothetical protein DC522_04765 [Microvirga sp. KLBC 81]|nr:hypothetical protein DC522_04765 [Microvirga sp. KLBC 81]